MTAYRAVFTARHDACAMARLRSRSTRRAAPAYVPRVTKWFSFPLLALLLAACGPRPELAPATGAYGPAATNAPVAARPVLPDQSALQPWTNGDFAVLESELSPATLYRAKSRSLFVFSGLAASGLGAPSHVAIPTQVGPKIFKNGERIDATRLNECWLVAWFAGAPGWTNWDVPFLVVLQRKPLRIQLGTNGLAFTFPAEAGLAAVMPIYGHYKPAALDARSNAVFQVREPKKRVQTWRWADGLPADPLARARYWARALHEFPVHCADTFSVDRARDAVVVRQKFKFFSWDDEWQTPHLKLAPVSPVLGLALHGGFPAEFSKKPFDMEIPTPWGPLFGVEDADEYDIALRVLRYVNETVAGATSTSNASPVAVAALETLRAAVQEGLRAGGPRAPGDEVFAKALPYLDETPRAAALTELKRRFQTDTPADLEALWTYAHFTGDWALVQKRWADIRGFFARTRPARWAGFGRDAAPAFADEAAPCLAFARLAYKAGDLDGYAYGGQLFARALVQHWAQQRGGAWFRLHQPWHSMEAMDDEVYPTRVSEATGGWEIDGPKYPAQVINRWSEWRWLRFGNEDVARFHREFLLEDSRRELGRLAARWPSGRFWTSGPNLPPPLVQLRALLLDENSARLTNAADVAKISGPPAVVAASCLAVLQTSRRQTVERLIPGGPATAFATGLEREVDVAASGMAHRVEFQKSGALRRPSAMWPVWRAPSGAVWNFGEVAPSTNAPARVETIPLNWNSRAVVYGQ
jgi:hypothetical protein